MTLYHSTFATPFGPFSVAVDADGALVATAFGDTSTLRRRLPRTEPAVELVEDAKRTAAVREQVLSYARGERQGFDLPLNPIGTPFQRRVWHALGRIRWGETQSYGQIARRLRTSARAVGRANATNPVCLVVPCHRVVGADGSLTGFAFGEPLKQRLLAHEAGGE